MPAVCCMQVLSVELDSLRSELDMLSDLSGQLVSVSGQQETGHLDRVVNELSTEWQLTSDQCQRRLHVVNNALQQATVFNEQLAVSTVLSADYIYRVDCH